MDDVKKYWVSWYGCYETLGAFTLYSPWWISGLTMDEPERQTLCAAIKTVSEDSVKEIIYAAYDKMPDAGAIEFRFIEECEDNWEPFSERFPEGAWMGPYWRRPHYIAKEITGGVYESGSHE